VRCCTVVYPAHFEKNIKIGELIPPTLAMIKESNRSLLFSDKDRFIQKITATLIPTPRSHKEIISVKENNTILPSVSEIHELEIGPNRCNISG
jgi:hypothetical protein